MNEQIKNHQKTALILGATGSFGSSLLRHLAGTGWQVRALTRKADQPELTNVQWIAGDLENASVMSNAVSKVDVIVHAVNVPYPKWDPLMIKYTKAIIELAISNQAHLLFVGNIYNAGIPKDGVVYESTPNLPINEKGEIRAVLEGMIADAADRGLRSTIMRFGDFFGHNIQGPNWFKELTKNVHKNKLTFAGPANVNHTWAYLPDAAKACEEVLSIRVADATLPHHMVLPFAGHVFSFTQLQTVIESELKLAGLGNQLANGTAGGSANGLTGELAGGLKTSDLPWTLFRMLGLVLPLMRDIVSMRYLWNHEIRMDGGSLSNLLGGAPTHTPLNQAVLNSVSALSGARQQTVIGQSA